MSTCRATCRTNIPQYSIPVAHSDWQQGVCRADCRNLMPDSTSSLFFFAWNKATGAWTWPHTMYIVSKWSCVRGSTASVRPSCLWLCYRRCVFLLPTNWSVAEPVPSPQNPKAGRRANGSPPLDRTWLQWIQSAASHCVVPNSRFNIVLLSMPVSSKGSFPLMVSDQTLYGALTCPIFRTFPSWFGPGVHKSRAPCRVLKKPSALASCHLSDAVSFEESARFLEKKLCAPDLTISLTLVKNVNFKPFASSEMSRALGEFRRTELPHSSGESKMKAPWFSETSGTQPRWLLILCGPTRNLVLSTSFALSCLRNTV